MEGHLKIPQGRKANMKWGVPRFRFFNGAGNRVTRSSGNRWSQKTNLPLSPALNLIFIRRHCNQAVSLRSNFPLPKVCSGSSSTPKNGRTPANCESCVQHERRELYKISHCVRPDTPCRPHAPIDDAFLSRMSHSETHHPREGIRWS